MRREVRKKTTEVRGARNLAGRARNLFLRNTRREREKDLPEVKVGRYVARMTNWQRHQWVKAGRPGDVASLERFCLLPHWKRASR